MNAQSSPERQMKIQAAAMQLQPLLPRQQEIFDDLAWQGYLLPGRLVFFFMDIAPHLFIFLG